MQGGFSMFLENKNEKNLLTLGKYHSIIFKRAKVRVFCCTEIKT